MRSIFCGEEAQITKVFSTGTIEKLICEAGLENKIYSAEDIRNNPQDLADVEYIFSTWGMAELTEDEIKNIFPKLKCVFYAAGSVQYFARPFLNCGVKVFSAWAANAVPVAEYTVAQIILANKGFFSSSRIFKENGHAAAKDNFSPYPGNYGENVGIIGAGMIGKLVIEMLKSYKLNVLVFDPFLSDEKAAELGVRKVSLEELLSSCRVVSNHLANNAQTQGMLNYSHFSSMMKNATFLNTGRGAQVVEEDLIRALSERPDLTAILDVTFPEPPEDDSGFYRLPNCILTPHIAGSSGNEVHRMAEYMLDEFLRYKNNCPCLYEVTAEMLKTMA